MKRKLGNFMQLGIVTALGISVLLSIFIQEISLPSVSAERMEISVIFREWNNNTWGEIRLGMEKAASDYEAELRFLTPQQANSSSEQQRLIEQEIKNGADGLVIIPATETIQQFAKEQISIPCVMMESSDGQKGHGFSPDSEIIGQMLAEAAAVDLPAGSCALLVNNLPGNAGIQNRISAIQDALTETGFQTIQTDGSDWSELRGQADFLILPEPGSAVRLFELLDESQLDIPVYTVGYSQEIVSGLEKGTIQAAVIWNSYGEGYLAIQQIASRLLNITPPDSAPAVILVRKEDMYEPESQKVLFPIDN